MNNTNSKSEQDKINPDILNKWIITAIENGGGKDIKKFDLRLLEDASTDYYIICHGSSSTQISGIMKEIAKRVSEHLKEKPYHSEGTNSWMIIDYFSVVVHIFSEEKRKFYNLEGLWSDAITTTY